MPTLLGLCGVPIPTTVEGLDFSGFRRGGKSPSPGAALLSCVAPFGQWTRPGRRSRRSLAPGDYPSAFQAVSRPWRASSRAGGVQEIEIRPAPPPVEFF